MYYFTVPEQLEWTPAVRVPLKSEQNYRYG